MANLFRQGEHICAVFDTEEQYLAIAAEYVADGLLSGEQVLYVCQSDAAVHAFRAALRNLGINVEAVRKRGALIESTHAAAHLATGRFDCERMLTLLNDAVETALNSGFTGLRACGDMSWLLVQPEGADQALEYRGATQRVLPRRARLWHVLVPIAIVCPRASSITRSPPTPRSSSTAVTARIRSTIRRPSLPREHPSPTA